MIVLLAVLMVGVVIGLVIGSVVTRARAKDRVNALTLHYERDIRALNASLAAKHAVNVDLAHELMRNEHDRQLAAGWATSPPPDQRT